MPVLALDSAVVIQNQKQYLISARKYGALGFYFDDRPAVEKSRWHLKRIITNISYVNIVQQVPRSLLGPP